MANAQNADVLLVLAHRAFLDRDTIDLLKTNIEKGKIVLAWDDVAQVIETPRQSWSAGWSKLPDTGGLLYVVSSTYK